MRAAIAAESAGIPSVSLVCEGFEGQARATGRGMGYDDLAVVVLVGHVDAQTVEEMTTNFVTGSVPAVIAGLSPDETDGGATVGATGAGEPDRSELSDEPGAVDRVFSGTLDEVQRHFVDRGWSDGLPVVPPTLDRVEAFIEPSGHDPWRSLGVAKSSGRDLTIWSVAVNAVMAGCDPRHLPVLIAATEILADPHYGAEHSGNTTGADALMILNGPMSTELGFNSGQGALREGAQANTTVGRWLRLYLRNVLDFTADQHDKATFGNSARVVLSEDHETLDAIGWDPVAADFGYDRDDNVLTMARFNSGAIVGSVFGARPDDVLPSLGDGLARVTGWDLTHVHGLGTAQYRPLLILTPILARIFADAGWSKDDVKAGLFDHARIPAWRFEKLIGEWSNLTAGRRTLIDMASVGDVPAVYAESDDPDRLVPVVTEPAKFVLAVAGDPNRTNAYVLSNDGPHGDYTAKAIDYEVSADLQCRID